jgi:hypothetical protein
MLLSGEHIKAMVVADSFRYIIRPEDQTKVEIWYQLNAYVIEMEAV